MSCSKGLTEWVSPYNPFNSMKVLRWYENLKGCVSGNFLPPVQADTNPTNICNFNCIWCNTYDFRKRCAETMPEGHLIKLADFYKDWGVRATCVAGGGEPMVNEGFARFLHRLSENGIESGVITNASLLGMEQAEAIAVCSRWCGISMDAGTPEAFMKVKGLDSADMFYRVIENIKCLVHEIKKAGRRVDIGYKFLIHPDNCSSILEGARLAKELGVRDFHARPVGWENLAITKDKPPLDFSPFMEDIKTQIEEARKLESQDFHVYIVTHKFGRNLEKKRVFSKCRATPLLSTFGADGNVHLCFDRRGREILCRHMPDPWEVKRVWGSARHKELIESIDLNTCPRCTYGPHNELIERAVINDDMCLNFP